MTSDLSQSFAQAKFQKYAPVVGTVKSILTYQRIHSMGLQHFVERRKTMNKILYRKRIEMKRKQETLRMKILRSSKQMLQDSRCIFSAYLDALSAEEECQIRSNKHHPKVNLPAHSG